MAAAVDGQCEAGNVADYGGRTLKRPIRKHVVFDSIGEILDRLDNASPVGKMISQLVEGLLRGRLEYYTVWDDLRAPASGINPPGAVSDPAMAEDGSLLFSHSAENLIAVLLQVPHAWKSGTNIEPHVHWSKTTDAAGDVAWEIRYRVFSVGDATPAWTEWMSATGRSADPGATQKHTIDGFTEIAMGDHTLSAMISLQLRRNVADGKDTYAAPAAMWEIDLHYQNDGGGSFEEYVKGEI